jgi:hypothetical protein
MADELETFSLIDNPKILSLFAKKIPQFTMKTPREWVASCVKI